jgi:uncharacterized protein
MKSKDETKWYINGLRFACTGCGECCRDHGEYTYVYLVKEDIQAMAETLALSTADFLKKYCLYQEDGLVHLRMGTARCPFLENECCMIYEVRPKQCRTWPFWTENLKEATWYSEVTPFCPGTGKGKLFSAEEIETIAAQEEEGFDEPLFPDLENN